MTGLRGLDALEDAIAAVAAQPRLLVSEAWRCRTGMCIAGHLADRAGGKWLTGPAAMYGDYLVPLASESAVAVRCGSRQGVHAADRAERILGFRRRLANRRDLFAPCSTLADLQAMYGDLRAAERAGKLRYAVQEMQ